MDKKFEVLPHTADFKLRAYGKDEEELFSHAVQGMFESLSPVWQEETVERSITVESSDIELLLVDFLSEALYFSDVYKEAYDKCVIEEISHTCVKGVLHGKKISGFESGEIKAVTHHELSVRLRDGVWVADVLFDI